MHTPFDFGQSFEERTVYVREIARADLPDEVRDALEPDQPVYAINDAEGTCIALAQDRAAAFAMARGHAYQPVSVH